MGNVEECWPGRVKIPTLRRKERDVRVGHPRIFLVDSMEFEISAGQVKALQKAGTEFLLLDVREPWELETARIEGAKNIPMGDVPARAHQELDPEAHIVVMCHHGVRSLTVTNWLRQQGFEKAQSMRGGIDGWARTVDPKVPLY